MRVLRAVGVAVCLGACLSAAPDDRDPDKGTEQRFRGKISGPTDINNAVATDSHRGFASASGVVSVRLYETRALTFHGWKAHTAAVTSIVFNSDLTVFATSGSDGVVKLWDVAAAAEYETKYDKFDSDNKGAPPSPPGPIFTLSGHAGPVNQVAFDADGKVLVSVGSDGTVRTWDPVNGKAIKVIRGHKGPVKSVALHPDGKLGATVGTDKSLRLWELATGKAVATLVTLPVTPERVAYSPDGHRLAVGGGQAGKPGVLKVFDAESGKELFDLAGHTDLVTWVAFHPNQNRLVSCGRDAAVLTWDLETGKLAYRDKHRDAILNLAFSASGTVLGTASNEIAKFWDGAANPP